MTPAQKAKTVSIFWLITFLFGGGVLGAFGRYVWADATQAQVVSQMTEVQKQNVLWLKRHDLEIGKLQIIDAGRDRDMRYIIASIEEIKSLLKEQRRGER